jgi:hypothetical protein
MLHELQRLHQEIQASLSQLDALTMEAEPPMTRLPPARLALTRASRARTLLLERLHEHLLLRASPDEKLKLEALKRDGKTDLIASAEHIGSWTLREITSRWPEYCSASHEMRSAMRRRVAREQQIIYPLLDAREATKAA